MKDPISFKIVIFWLGIIVFFSLMSLWPEEPSFTPKWVPRSEISDSEKARLNPPKGPGITWNETDNSYGWEQDKKDESNKWLEFLEDCENIGITPYDPDAQELWSERY